MTKKEIKDKIKECGGAKLVFDLYQPHHLLRFNGTTHFVNLTTKKVQILIDELSKDKESLGIGRTKYFF